MRAAEDSLPAKLSLNSSEVLRDLAEHRRTLLREGQHKLLFRALRMLQSKISQNSSEYEIACALMKNARWHCGIQIKSDYDVCKHLDANAAALDRIFTAYILNTAARYQDSIRVLAGLQPSPDLHIAEWYVGTNLNHALSTWRLWSCGELLDTESCKSDLDYIEAVALDHFNYDEKSNALLMLAGGVFHLAQGNYESALRLLLLSHKHDKGWWGHRIYSALSLCYRKIGNVRKSRHYIELALSGRGIKFGPSGWQLRIVDALALDGRFGEARQINQEIRMQAIKYSEVGYKLWTDVFDILHFREMPGAQCNPQETIKNLITLNMNSAMSRLAGVKYENTSNSSSCT